ncbi:MAG: carboxypeptidase-like regulatory domain-containing protein [candidate division WOR-3 bacterium]
MKKILIKIIIRTIIMLMTLLSCKADVTIRKPTYTLSGYVTNKDTHKPVVGCKVKIQNKEDMTDSKGHYLISDLSPGNYNIQFQHPDYKPYSVNIEIGETDKTFDVELEDYVLETPSLINPPNGYTWRVWYFGRNEPCTLRFSCTAPDPDAKWYWFYIAWDANFDSVYWARGEPTPFVVVRGEPLYLYAPCQMYWRVKTTDDEGAESDWSETRVLNVVPALIKK